MSSIGSWAGPPTSKWNKHDRHCVIGYYSCEQCHSVSVYMCWSFIISQGDIFLRIFKSLKTLVNGFLPRKTTYLLVFVWKSSWLVDRLLLEEITVRTFSGMCGMWKESPNKLDIYHPVWDISIHFAPFFEPPIAKPCKIPPTSSTLLTGHLRNLNWRYLPYTRPKFQGISPQFIWPYMLQYPHFRILQISLWSARGCSWLPETMLQMAHRALGWAPWTGMGWWNVVEPLGTLGSRYVGSTLDMWFTWFPGSQNLAHIPTAQNQIFP